MGKVIGIDLGTTNSVVAIADGVQPRVLENKEGKSQTRSVVGLKKRKKSKKDTDGGEQTEILYGDVALDNWPFAPKDTIISIKRLIGRGVSDPEVQRVKQVCLYDIIEPSDGTKDSMRVMMGGKEYSPVEISSMILKKLKAEAEYKLGEKVTHAVITVPAYFSQRQKSDTRKAGLAAGLRVIKVLEEPTAAAVAFGVDSGGSQDPKCIMVYDLGGGTFDISILMWAGNVFAPLNLEGDMWLGGDDFDKVLMDRAVAYIKGEYNVDPVSDTRFMAELKKAAQKTKERLSSARTADLIVPGCLRDEDGDPVDVEMEVTRDDYERMIKPLVDRTEELVKTALKNAEMTIDQIDCVLMAGNSTGIPLVQQAMEKMFGQDKILRTIHPKHCVALGAAIVATRTGGIICQSPDPSDDDRECGHLNKRDATQCEKCGAPLVLERSTGEGEDTDEDNEIKIGGLAPFCYGIQSAGDVFTPFIDKGEQFPTENPKTQTFYTQKPNQRMIAVPVYNGEKSMEKASLNIKQGEAFAILPPELKAESPIRIRIWLDSDGVFDLSATLDDGRPLQLVLLQGEKDQKAVEAIQKVEETLNDKDIPPDRLAEVEAARNDAFTQFQQKNFDGALERARRAQEAITRGGDKDELVEDAESLIRFVDLIVHEYSWAFDANQVYLLNRLVEETRQALIVGDRTALKDKVDALDRATNNIPEVLRILLGLSNVIYNRIRPVDPIESEKLMNELADVKDAFRRRDPTAPTKLGTLSEKVSRAIEKTRETTQKQSEKCPTCGVETEGKRFCSNGHDQWQLVAKSSGPGPGKIISSDFEL